jgi:hypothetical protein
MGGLDPPIQGNKYYAWMAGSEAGHGDDERGQPYPVAFLHGWHLKPGPRRAKLQG